jgi:hypothetical protein
MKPRVRLPLKPILLLSFSRIVTESVILRGPMPFTESAKPALNRKAGVIIIEPLMTSDGETIDFELGTLYVPENRSDPMPLNSFY